MSGASTKNMIRTLLGISDEVSVIDAEVVSVDLSRRVCKVTAVSGKSANEITARLMASVDDGCLMIPKVGSNVIVSFSDSVQPFVSMFSEIEKIVWLGGEYDGVPIVKHPTNSNKGLLKKINNIEDKLNTLISNFNSHTHIYIAGAAPYALPGTSSAPTTSTVSPPLTTTTQADIEHPNIKH